jgi:hypothetical protein
MTLDRFALNRVNSCNKSFWAQNLYYLKSIRAFFISKNFCFYYGLKKRIGEQSVFTGVNKIEKIILVFGREQTGKRPWSPVMNWEKRY